MKMNKDELIKDSLINLLQIGDKIKIKNIRGIYPTDHWYRIYFNDWIIAEINELDIRIEAVGLELSYSVYKDKVCVENNELFINILDILKIDNAILKNIR